MFGCFFKSCACFCFYLMMVCAFPLSALNIEPYAPYTLLEKTVSLFEGEITEVKSLARMFYSGANNEETEWWLVYFSTYEIRVNGLNKYYFTIQGGYPTNLPREDMERMLARDELPSFIVPGKKINVEIRHHQRKDYPDRAFEVARLIDPETGEHCDFSTIPGGVVNSVKFTP